jgi:hypothetical protein
MPAGLMPSGYPHTHPAILHCLLPWLVHVLCHFLGISFSFALLRPRPLPIIPACHHALHQGLLGCHMGLGSSTCDPQKRSEKKSAEKQHHKYASFLLPERDFSEGPCAKRKYVGEENPGFRKRVGSPACGGGVEEGEPARSAKIFFFAALEGDFIINSFSWTASMFAFTD